MSSSKILVFDANQLSALAFVRSLGRRYISVAVADFGENPLAAGSRYWQNSYTYTDPMCDAEAAIGQCNCQYRRRPAAHG